MVIDGLTLCFAFQRYDDHRHLHSFPTRRSSDLAPRARAWCRARSAAARPREGAQQQIRSEEHTSELQSLRHLVCRLLLEKKKEGSAQASSTAEPQSEQTRPSK